MYPRFASSEAIYAELELACRLTPTKAVASNQTGRSDFSVPTKEFKAPNGTVVHVLEGDYGFRSGSNRMYDERYGEVPGNIFQLVRFILLPHCA